MSGNVTSLYTCVCYLGTLILSEIRVGWVQQMQLRSHIVQCFYNIQWNPYSPESPYIPNMTCHTKSTNSQIRKTLNWIFISGPEGVWSSLEEFHCSFIVHSDLYITDIYVLSWHGLLITYLGGKQQGIRYVCCSLFKIAIV